MRIAGYIEHPILKITIFQMEGKFTVKFETGLFEIAYKFRQEADLNSVEDIHQLVDEAFTAQVLEQMHVMRRQRAEALERLFPPRQSGDEFEEII
jgi:hypothetical protein